MTDPARQWKALASDPAVGFIQPAFPVKLLAGTGVKIGNIDGGYLNFAAAQDRGL